MGFFIKNKTQCFKIDENLSIRQASLKNDAEFYISMFKQQDNSLSEKEYKRLVKFQIENTELYILHENENIFGIVDVMELELSNIDVYTLGLKQIKCDYNFLYKHKKDLNSLDIENKVIKSLFNSQSICHIKIFTKENIKEINKYKTSGYKEIPTHIITEYTEQDKKSFTILYCILNNSTTKC